MLKQKKQEDEHILIATRPLQKSDYSKESKTGSFIENKIKEIKKPLSAKRNEDTVIVANSYPIESCEANGGTMVEIEWWYQTYVNGVLIYEEYVYSTYECWGGGGGGGGGGGTPTDYQLCQLNNSNALATAVATNTMISEQFEQNSDLSRTKLYSWQYAKAGIGGTLKGVAYDRGVHKRANTKANTPWTFESLAHIASSVQGSFVGPAGTSLELTVIHGEPIVGIYHAKMFIIWRADTKSTKGAIVATDYDTKNNTMTYNLTTPPLIEY